LQRLTGFNELELAWVVSFGRYMMFRGYRRHKMKQDAPRIEKCRVAFLADTDRGPLHIKNVDDPLDNWRPAPPLPSSCPKGEFWWDAVEYVADGTGSGLHIDDEPAEIFPLPLFAMAGQHAHDAQGLADFLRRYSPFWGGGNLLVYDRGMSCLAIEKTSHNHFAAYLSDADGHNHISGMTCRDTESAQARYVAARRQEYLRIYDLSDDGPDARFWRHADELEARLGAALASLGKRPRFEDVVELFLRPWPDGLRETGVKMHPDQGVIGYTHYTRATLLAERSHFHWQLSADGRSFDQKPQICRYE
jgi:hypothetical protein